MQRKYTTFFKKVKKGPEVKPRIEKMTPRGLPRCKFCLPGQKKYPPKCASLRGMVGLLCANYRSRVSWSAFTPPASLCMFPRAYFIRWDGSMGMIDVKVLGVL